MPTQGIRNLAAYTCFCSPATSAGRDGVEIWISKDIPFVIDDQEVIVRPSMVHAQYVAPTMLVLALHVKHARIDVCAARAPTSKATRLQRQHWWDKLEAALADARDPSAPLDLLIDANARLGSECSEAIGAHHAQREDYAGQRLRVIADRCHLLLPQTWEGLTDPGPSHTWSSRISGRHRIDYVCVPACSDNVSSRVHRDVNISGGTEGHCLVTATGGLAVPIAGQHVFRRQQADNATLPQAPDPSCQVCPGCCSAPDCAMGVAQ